MKRPVASAFASSIAECRIFERTAHILRSDAVRVSWARMWVKKALKLRCARSAAEAPGGDGFEDFRELRFLNILQHQTRLEPYSRTTRSSLAG